MQTTGSSLTPGFEIVHGIPVGSGGGGFGFHILLWPCWKEVVAMNKVDTSDILDWHRDVGNSLLEACGFNRAIYTSSMDIRLSFGEWGLEHITVPGNSCGIDIDLTSYRAPEGGAVLTPHNVDSLRQAYLIQLVFGWFSHNWLSLARLNRCK